MSPAISRKLTTILAADVARYSELMSADEEDALQTLHAYLAVLFKTDRSDADRYWRDGRPAGGEGELRTLVDVTGIRADNTRPEPLDAQPVPDALQIPVRLRVGGTGPLRHYSGHYRMQYTPDGWRITSASIEPSPTPR